MRKSWEFVLAGTGTIGTAIFAPHERSLRMANMIASFIVGALVPIRHMDGARAERWVGAVVDALPAFGSRVAAKVRPSLRSIILVRSHWPYDQAVTWDSSVFQLSNVSPLICRAGAIDSVRR